MVAKNIRLPNIRRMFVPDPGHIIVDADLAGADAQVVAWECNDKLLKDAFKAKKKIHVVNARTVWPEYHASMSDADIADRSPYYKKAKQGVHATNYGATPPALVSRAGWSLKEAQEFQEKWFFAHPNIKAWHLRTERCLIGQQCWNCYRMIETVSKKCSDCGMHLGGAVKNPFGFRRKYFDRVDAILPEALAWGPQSTVALCSELGWINISQGPRYLMQWMNGSKETFDWSSWVCDLEAHSKYGNIVQFLIQVHDSIVFQIPQEYEDEIPSIVKSMEIVIPYDEPLIIPLGHKHSRLSWGDCG